MEKLHASDWLKTSAFSCNKSAKLWREKTLQVVRMVSKFRLSCLSVMFFHLNYYQVRTWFLLQFGMVGTGKFFKGSGSCDLFFYSCLLTPKCTRNHVITYTNKSANLQHGCKLQITRALSKFMSVLTVCDSFLS